MLHGYITMPGQQNIENNSCLDWRYYNSGSIKEHRISYKKYSYEAFLALNVCL
jgi:hypothetical protein